MKARLFMPGLVIATVGVTFAAASRVPYDWKVGDEFEITGGEIVLFFTLSDAETVIEGVTRIEVDTPLARKVSEVWFRSEKLKKGAKIEVIDFCVVRITMEPKTCYRVEATKGTYTSGGWFINNTLFNDYSAQPSPAVMKRSTAEALKKEKPSTNIPYNDSNYIKNYIIPGNNITVESALSSVIDVWREKGKIVEVGGWETPLEYSTYVEYRFTFFIALDQKYVAYLLEPRPRGVYERRLETHGQGIPIISLTDFSRSYPLFDFYRYVSDYNYERRPCFICKYHFQVSLQNGEVRAAYFSRTPASHGGRGLPPFNSFTKRTAAYSDYWPFSDQGYEPEDRDSVRILEEFEDYDGVYYFTRDGISTIRPESMANVRECTYKSDAFEVENRFFDNTGNLEMISKLEYDSCGKPVSEKWVTLQSDLPDETKWVYEKSGRLISYIDKEISIMFSYDQSGFLISASFFDNKGKRTCPNLFDGIHRYEWVYPADGKSVIEKRYNPKGEIVGKGGFDLY